MVGKQFHNTFEFQRCDLMKQTISKSWAVKDCSTSKLSANYFRLIIIAICIEYSYYNTLMLNELMFTDYSPNLAVSI